MAARRSFEIDARAGTRRSDFESPLRALVGCTPKTRSRPPAHPRSDGPARGADVPRSGPRRVGMSGERDDDAGASAILTARARVRAPLLSRPAPRRTCRHLADRVSPRVSLAPTSTLRASPSPTPPGRRRRRRREGPRRGSMSSLQRARGAARLPLRPPHERSRHHNHESGDWRGDHLHVRLLVLVPRPRLPAPRRSLRDAARGVRRPRQGRARERVGRIQRVPVRVRSDGQRQSYSMVGPPDGGGEDDEGIVPRACREIFARFAEAKARGVTGRVEVTMIEIHNERVRDLLDPDAGSGGTTSLRVRTHPVEGPYVEGLTPRAVRDYDEIRALMDRGAKARTTAATAMNATSSRAHTVDGARAATVGTDGSEISSLASLVDLAGSERSDATAPPARDSRKARPSTSRSARWATASPRSPMATGANPARGWYRTATVL